MGDENCLTLNVWSPDPAGRHPVLVWLHGGGFASGSGQLDAAVGAELASRGHVVLVTLNYRLGLLGFAAHEALRNDAGAGCGNWGLEDQVAALRWVRANIAEFGGDPSRVTLGGHSAGAISVYLHMAAPVSRGLFHRAVALSGWPDAVPLGASSSTLEWALERDGRDPDWLRQAAPADLLRVQEILARAGKRFALRPTVDGGMLGEDPFRAFRKGRVAEMPPLLFGATYQESRSFYVQSSYLDRISEDSLLRRLGGEIGSRDRAAEVLRHYGDAMRVRGERVLPGDVYATIQSDRGMWSPQLAVAAAAAPSKDELFGFQVRPAPGDGQAAAAGLLRHRDPVLDAGPVTEAGWRPSDGAVQDLVLRWAAGRRPRWKPFDGDGVIGVIDSQGRNQVSTAHAEASMWTMEELAR